MLVLEGILGAYGFYGHLQQGGKGAQQLLILGR